MAMAEPDAQLYRVMLLNDDETPMEFVVHVLEDVFGLDPEEAMRRMLRIHKDGSGACGSYPRAEAEQKVTGVRALARERKFPLQCVMEKI
jgi:ATP-dependent Clp protease adaptor protein ClpS